MAALITRVDALMCVLRCPKVPCSAHANLAGLWVWAAVALVRCSVNKEPGRETVRGENDAGEQED